MMKWYMPYPCYLRELKLLLREQRLVRQRRLIRLTVVMPNIPGSLSRLLDILAQTRINVVDVDIE